MKIEKFGSITAIDGNLIMKDFTFDCSGTKYENYGEVISAGIAAVRSAVSEMEVGSPKINFDFNDIHSEKTVAPPVAAGSVDTTEFKRLCNALYLANPSLREGERLRMVDHINAWGAQQREAGRQEGFSQLQPERESLQNLAIISGVSIKKAESDVISLQKLVIEAQEHAEKAEADAALLGQERDNLMRLATSRREWAEKAEARVKELEDEIYSLQLELSRERN